ncbi:MAG: ATP-binding protein [bacterium]
MKTIAFISGKGGTGKTSLVGAFAHLAAPVVLADCDVDAANLALLLPGKVVYEEPFFAGELAAINPDRCACCGLCAQACRFDAIRDLGTTFAVDPLACEGCRVCAHVCEFDAVELMPNEAGVVQRIESKCGPLVRAELRPAQSNSGKMVTRVRTLAREQAEAGGYGLVLLDGPPGIGCPVHATLANVDLAVVVTEPTPSGRHDLERALTLLDRFELPGRVIVNKADLSPSMTNRVTQLAVSRGIGVVGRLPFTEAAPWGLAQGRTLLDVEVLRHRLTDIWERLTAAVENQPRSAPSVPLVRDVAGC